VRSSHSQFVCPNLEVGEKKPHEFLIVLEVHKLAIILFSYCPRKVETKLSGIYCDFL
jgi:hypothetical protein